MLLKSAVNHKIFFVSLLYKTVIILYCFATSLSLTPLRFGLFISHSPGKYFAKLAISTNSRQNRASVDRLLKQVNSMLLCVCSVSSINLLTLFHECRSLIGYASHYPVVDSE